MFMILMLNNLNQELRLNVFCLKFQETSVSRMSSNVLMVLAFLGDGLVTITVTVSLTKTRQIVQNVLKKSSGDLN